MEILEEQRRSGKPVREFCKSRGVHRNTFYQKRKLYVQQKFVAVAVTGSE
jgi:hypothetical protein